MSSNGVTTYATHDGFVVRGTPHQVVRKLRDRQWNAPDAKRDWMVQVCERIAHVTDTPRVQTFSNVRDFLDLLLESGLLRIAD